MVATKKGIYHNLNESRYAISNSEIAFFFSSELYLNKFLSTYIENRDNMNKKTFKCESDVQLNHNVYFDYMLYSNIEKRGSRVTMKGLNMSWQEKRAYVLRKMIEPISQDWQRIVRQK